WFDATAQEQHELTDAVSAAREAIRQKSKIPDGFNIGVNVGPAAGQTVDHIHVHVIPRYFGDVDDPRGGVRYVIPARANYPSDHSKQLPAHHLLTGESDQLSPQLISQMANH